MAAPKPTFLFVPGAWHKDAAWHATAGILKEKGYASSMVNLASVDADPALKGFEPDVEVIRDELEKLVSAGKDVVLVMHSYGGVPGSEAMKYFLDKNEGEGGRGKIVRLAWITGFVAPKGVSLFMGVGGANLPWWRVEGDYVHPINPQEVFYNDVPPEAANMMCKKLGSMSYRPFHSPVTVEPWRTVPSSYLVCERDNAIIVQGQDHMIHTAKEIAPSAFDLVERVDSSHSPFLSMPDRVAEYLIRAAGGV